MKENKQLASCVVPAYNGEQYLRDAIESIFAQDYRPLEVIVVDDGSTDSSATIAQSFKDVTLIQQLNQGVAAARNTALGAACGDFIAFLDQDDLWMPDKLSIQIDYLLQHPTIQFTFTEEEYFLEGRTSLPEWFKNAALLNRHAGVNLGTVVARRTVFDQIGDFDIRYRFASDSDWLFRANAAAVSKALVPKVLLRRRIHDKNESAKTGPALAELRQVIKNSIVSRRAAESIKS